jgi:hypothetical protein
MKAIKRLVSAAILLGAVTAIAQPDPSTDPAAPAAPPPTTTVTAPGKVDITVGEMRSRSETIQAQIGEDYRAVVALRERVRKMKDVIKLDCVNDRLVQLKAQMNIGDRAKQSLDAALDKDPTGSRDVFSQLERTGNSVKELREQAAACVGEPELYKQEAGLEVTRPDLPDDPGTFDPFEPSEVPIEPPGYASAFL